MRLVNALLLAMLLLGCRPDGANDDLDSDGFLAADDCDDTDASVHPGSLERCNGVDDDCDGTVDDNPIDPILFYPDQDGDGYGVYEGAKQACTAPFDFAASPGDCDDLDPDAHPGADERCDGVDDDCDGDVDVDAVDATAWYPDRDQDGYGDGYDAEYACEQPAGYVATADDCDDRDYRVYPGAPEDDCTDPTDYNCDGSVTYEDRDGDGVPACQDCDDRLPFVYPGAVELCNALDDDCDGTRDDNAADAQTLYVDGDGDGWGDAAESIRSCVTLPGYSATWGDCDDSDGGVHPGADERCDGVDNDCDGDLDEHAIDATVWFADLDGDGYPGSLSTQTGCEQPDGYGEDPTDCDDLEAGTHPGADERCDGADDDCDGTADEDAVDAGVAYVDVDGDGYGDSATATPMCGIAVGYVARAGDCDDDAPAAHPGGVELCNDLDDDCNGEVDDEALDAPSWFPDEDGDGWGAQSGRVLACESPEDYVASYGDCDDHDDAVYPRAAELCDGIDNDCDGDLDEYAIDAASWYADLDGDGHAGTQLQRTACRQPPGFYATAGDCDDFDAASWPGADEVCDEVDNDCDGDVDEDAVDAPTWYGDRDGDGFGSPADVLVSCVARAGYTLNAGDCDDALLSVSPMGVERCNGVDDDCNGVVDDDAVDASYVWADGDGDGYGDPLARLRACELPAGYVSNDGDCDDTDAGVSPRADETCDAVDNDCDGAVDEHPVGAPTWYADADGDGYGAAGSALVQCEQPLGYVDNARDCDDAEPLAWWGAEELCDGVDNDCDGAADSGLAGADAVCAAESCAAVLDARPMATDGSYLLDPAGDGAVFPYVCDMTTDGGGWTVLVDWDRESRGDSLWALEGQVRVDLNTMGDWTETASAVRWSDYDASADILRLVRDVDIPNAGETRVDVHYEGLSLDGSGTWLYADAGGVLSDIRCAGASDVSAYTPAEQAVVPYTCTPVTGDVSWDEVIQTTHAAEVRSVLLTSMHYDSAWDTSYLYRLWVAIR